MVDGQYVCKWNDRKLTHTGWFQGRPIKKTHTVTLEDGTKVELSEDSWNALKEGAK